MLSIECCSLFGIDVLSARDKLRHFGAIMICNGEDGVVSLRYREFRDEVQRDGLEGKCF